MQESVHVFIKAGFRYQFGRSQQPDPINILEMGFGTGLNAFLTAIEASTKKAKVYYVAIEQFPITMEEFSFLITPTVFSAKKFL
jgi:tRNA U34 5-methylaminomethyl-2-thiouridine-forming methyltransferase MnmC